MDTVLIGISDALATIVARVAPALAAIRVAPDRQQPGLLWREDMVITAEAGLPGQETWCLVRPGRAVLSGRLALRDAGSGIAAIGLGVHAATPGLTLAGPTQPGALAVLVGTTAEAEPTARLAMVHAVAATDGGSAAGRTAGPTGRLILDIRLRPEAAGGPVLDAAGHLLGLAVAGPDGLARVVPHAALTALFAGVGTTSRARRGWLGLALQPVATATGFGLLGSGKGRRVVGVEPASPGALAGITVGDTLLAIDGRAINGQHSLREFLTGERVGQTIELRLARNDMIETRRLTVAPHPQG